MNTLELIQVRAIKFNGYKVELSENKNGKPVARLFKLLTVGKNKDTFKLLQGYYFATEQRREEWIKEQMNSIKNRIASNTADKTAKKEAISSHPFKVGDCLYQSWGYDQTNIDFYEVVEVLPRSVKVRKIYQRTVKGSNGYMCENVMPSKGSYKGNDIETKPVKCYISNKGTQHEKPTYYVPNGRHHLSIYDGGEKGVYQSHYA